MQMWVVYDHPSDHPDAVMARRFIIDRSGVVATEDVFVCNDRLPQPFAEVRAFLRGLGLIPMKRYESDDPVIVEVWL